MIGGHDETRFYAAARRHLDHDPRPAEVRADLARVAREARLLRSLLRLSARAISEHDRPELEAARR